MRPLLNNQEFLALSSFLNYQLSGEPVNWRGILNLVVGDQLDDLSEEFMLDTFYYLGEAYGNQKRRLGPLAILHPIRAAALLAKAQKEPVTLDLLATLLHDKNEDLTEENYDPENWERLTGIFNNLLAKIDDDSEWLLNERVYFLTKQAGQKYHEYLGSLLKEAKRTPSLAAIKLADRLDNTLDLRIDLIDTTDDIHCFQVIFDVLYVTSYKGIRVKKPHPVAKKINGAMRLYQLYKNAVFLSIIREMEVPLDHVAENLAYSLAVASIREAQSILLHIFAFHVHDPGVQRTLLREVMIYSDAGGFSAVTQGGTHRLDGLFTKYFAYKDKKMKQSGLESLYRDKTLMGQAAMAFLVIFANFINDDSFTIKGISSEGIIPQN